MFGDSTATKVMKIGGTVAAFLAAGGVLAWGVSEVMEAGEQKRREEALDALLLQRMSEEAAALEANKLLTSTEAGHAAFKNLLAGADDATKAALAPLGALLNGEVKTVRTAAEGAGRQLSLTTDRLAVRVLPSRLFAST